MGAFHCPVSGVGGAVLSSSNVDRDHFGGSCRPGNEAAVLPGPLKGQGGVLKAGRVPELRQA